MKTIAPTLRRSFKLKALILATLLPGLSVLPVPLQANPYGPNVVAGGANFQGLGTANLNINQTSNSAVINWQGFSIESGEVTTFNQPSVNSFALNRVVSGDPSSIYGSLNANGSVIVVNPNGIVVGPNGLIDVAGMLTMSTLDIDDGDLLDGGSNRFQGNAGTGITNYGAVSSSGGDVVFLGNFLQNAGTVSAPDGTVAFGSGGDILVEQGISGATISVQGAGPSGAVGIDNSGSVDAAAVEFKTTGNAYGLAIQNTGVVRANGASVRGGRVMLSAGSQGTIINTGTISARNQNGSGGQVGIDGGSVLLEAGSLDAAGVGGQVGGDVNVNASNIVVGGEASIDVSGSVGGAASLVATSAATLNGAVDASGSIGNGGSFDFTGAGTSVGADAVVNVSGRVDGGSARIGGGFQGADPDLSNSQASAVEAGSLVIADGEIGNAGTVVVWSDGDTTFNGEILAEARGVGNGGFVEVSGLGTLQFDGFVSTLSASGNSGTLLLDPTNVTIGAGGDITKAALTSALGGGNVVIHTSSSETDLGNITVLNGGGDLFYNSENHLSLFAHGNVIVDDNIQNDGGGNINIFAGWDGTGADRFTFDPTSPGFTGGGEGDAGDISFASLSDPANFGDFGNEGGALLLNSGAFGEVAVGSAGGETNLFGSVLLATAGNGADEFTQVGYFRFDGGAASAGGDINVRTKSLISLTGTGAADAHVMIGHGGSNSVNQANRIGDSIEVVDADISVVSESGGILMRGGGFRSFNQIGHGGMESFGNLSGDVTVEGAFLDMLGSSSAANQEFAGVRVGHGGVNEMIGVFSGDISVSVDNYVKGISGLENAGGGGSIVNPAGSEGDIVQIGHGGYRSGVVGAFEHNWTNNTSLGTNTGSFTTVYNAGGNATIAGGGVTRDPNSEDGRAVSSTMAGHTGAIHVEAKAGEVSLTPGIRGRGFAQIGHGGYNAHGNHNTDMVSDGTQTTATLQDGITVIAGTSVSMLREAHPTASGVGDRSYGQIGLGGWGAAGRWSGDINITAGTFFLMEAGEGEEAYRQVGHGGAHQVRTSPAGYQQNSSVLSPDNGHATFSGDISITAGDNIEAYAGSRDARSYAMIGHGGYFRTADYRLDGAVVAETEWGHHGDIDMNAGGSVIVQAKPQDSALRASFVNNQNWARVGHGGYESRGDHWGDVSITATEGSVIVHAGLGGYEEYRPANHDYNGAQTGAQNFVQIGHGGYLPGIVRQGDTRNNNGSRRFLDNGNRGQNGIGNVSGTTSDITITAGADFELLAQQEIGDLAFFQTSQFENDETTGEQTTVTRDPRVRAQQNWAHVGHGGFGDANGARTINRTATTVGAISITTGGDLTVQAGQIPQIDLVTTEGSNGEIARSTAPGGVDYLEQNWSQIGHGGFNYETGYTGNVFVNAGGDVDIQGGLTEYDFARVGHGGYQAGVNLNGSSLTVPFNGAITVLSGNDLNVQGGYGNNINANALDMQFQWAQIGHGALGRDANVNGDITIAASNDLRVEGGFGQGFGLNPGERNLDTSITTLATTNYSDGNALGGNTDAAAAIRDAYAHIGHGGMGTGGGLNGVNGATNGDLTGDIDVTAGNDIFLTDNSSILVGPIDTSARNWAKIGHGDTNSRERNASFRPTRAKSGGIWNGDIYVKAGRDITSVGGAIGHADPTNNDGVTNNLDGITRSLNGETFIAVGRATAEAGSGVLTLSENPLATGDLRNRAVGRITSSFLGLGPGELRIYTTDAAGNQIAEGSSLNGEAYTRTPAPGSGRNDESLATEFTLGTGSFGEPTGSFTPEGDYAGNSFGPYNVYFFDPENPPGPGGPGGPTVILTPEQQLFYNNLLNVQVAGERDQDGERYVYYADAYGNLYIVGVGLDEVIYEDNERYYYTFVEDALDSLFGNNPAGDLEVIEREEAEELIRRKRAASPSFGGVTVYTYHPDTNRYSSLRIFGVPQANLGIIE